MRRGKHLKAAVLSCMTILFLGCARTDTGLARRAISALDDSLYARFEVSDELPLHASLDQCLLQAARNNPGLAASFYRWRGAVEHVPQAQSLENPNLSYAWFIREVETRAGPQRHRLALSQRFPWFGKLKARGDAALDAARAAEQQYESRRLRLFFEVTRSYAEVAFLSRSIAITQENLELMNHWESVARAKFRAGGGTHAEVIKAQVEIGMLTDRLRTLTDLKHATLGELNALLSRPAGSDLQPQELPTDETTALSDEELLALLRHGNPELRSLEFEASRRRHEGRLASKQFYPDFQLGFSYTLTGPALDERMPESSKDPLTAEVALSLPLWRGRYAAAVREAQANVRAAEEDRRDRLQRLEAAVQRTAFELRDAGRKVRLYRDTLIPKGEQSLRAASTAFEAGHLDFLNVLDAQRVLLEFGLAYERAVADQRTHLAALEMQLGQALPAQHDQGE